MTTGKLLEIVQAELRFPFRLGKQIPCYVQIFNKTNDYIAFQCRTNDMKYIYVCRPDREVIVPRSACKVEVTMFMPRTEEPPDMQCKDNFILQSIVTFAGATMDDNTPELFTEESGNTVDQITLPVVYVPPTLRNELTGVKITTGELLEIKPRKLQFPFKLNKQISSSVLLTNKTDDHIAFKFMTSDRETFNVQPYKAILLPRSTCEVIVTMKEQREAPPDMRCPDAFLVHSVITVPGATVKNITHQMFFKDSGNTVDEIIVRAVYVSPPQSPSPIPEQCDKRSSYWASASTALRKFSNGLLRRRRWQSYIKINSDRNLTL